MEIGGEYWKEEIKEKNNINKKFFAFGKDNQFVLSGRTAIDTVIQDITLRKKIRNVYFPSYCCESMINPFIKHGIKIDYYNVFFENSIKYDIDLSLECDIFFAMNYFGYTSTNMEEYIINFKKKGAIIIEDFTQSLLSKNPFSKYSDYTVASLRKWFPITTGGIVCKLNEQFCVDLNSFEEDKTVSKIKNEAMLIKKNYINMLKTYEKEKYRTIEYIDDIKKIKNEFLDKYKKANDYIKNNYICKKMDDSSLRYLLNIDLEEIINKRKINTNVIYKKLNNKNIRYLVKEYNEQDDCLLYVPIYMNKEFLKYLKEKIYLDEYYCPSHWPIDSKINDLYKHELSLICDQRYSKKEIEDKISVINNIK